MIHISLRAETIAHFFGYAITNSMLMTYLTIVILVLVSFIATRNLASIPGKLQNFLEVILEFFISLADSILQDRKLTLKVLPVVCTLFLLIILSNWLGILPGVGSIGVKEIVHGNEVLTPIFRPTNADINATLAWALISIVTIQFFGIITLGFGSHISKYFNFKALGQFNFQGIVMFAVGILELFSEISKILSFSFRLFGNIFAGEVLLTVIAFLVPYLVPLPFYMLELFVGLIQGVVFTTLTLVFIKIAVTSHDSHASNKEHDGHLLPDKKHESLTPSDVKV